MRLETALYTSREGIDSHGKAIAVIGDNLSNANTTAFKGSRVEFADLLPSGREGSPGSLLPQSGSGVLVQEVRTLHEGGTLEFTGRTLDMGIEGNGFFMVGDDPNNPYLTRAGNFELNSEGILTTGSGDPVLGLGAESGSLGTINIGGVEATGTATTTMALSGNLSSAAAFTTLPNNPATFNEIAALASSTSSVSLIDSLGARHEVTLYSFKTGNNAWTVQGYVDGADVGGTAGTPTLIGETQLNFENTGVFAEGTEAVLNLQATFTGAAPTAVTADLSSMTQFAAASQLTGVTSDGEEAGTVQGYQVTPDGQIIAQLSSGAQVLVATLQLANVENLDGLQRIGDNLYIEGNESGDRLVGNPGSSGLGTIASASLELSNIDFSKEFVGLVIIQRGYQANAQVLNTTNDLIRDTIQLMR